MGTPDVTALSHDFFFKETIVTSNALWFNRKFIWEQHKQLQADGQVDVFTCGKADFKPLTCLVEVVGPCLVSQTAGV